MSAIHTYQTFSLREREAVETLIQMRHLPRFTQLIVNPDAHKTTFTIRNGRILSVEESPCRDFIPLNPLQSQPSTCFTLQNSRVTKIR